MTRLYWIPLLVAVFHGCAAPTTRYQQPDARAVAEEAARQRALALQLYQERSRRLHHVSYPLLVAAAPLCQKHTRWLTGVMLANPFQFREDFRKAARDAMGLGDGVITVTDVVPGSPADRAGLVPGDVIVEIAGEAVGTVEDADSATEAIGRYSEITRQGKPFTLSIRRGQQLLEAQLTPVQACDYPVVLADSDVVNAWADGKRVHVTRGIMRFTRSDQELALVIGHELAHNIERHVEAKMQNAMGGAIIDAMFGAATGYSTRGAFARAASQAYSQAFEMEADYVGLYIMARAGLPLENASLFWRRMAAEQPASIASSHTATHPATPARFQAIEQTIAEIRARQQAGQPLLPERRQPAKAAPSGNDPEDEFDDES